MALEQKTKNDAHESPRQWHLPMVPLTPVDIANRMAAATGSVRYAMAAADANYNGHHVTVYYNAYRGYWLAEYQWGERNVLSRGSLESALLAAKREHDKGARGCTVVVNLGYVGTSDNPTTDVASEFADAEGLLRKLGYVSGVGSQETSSWWTWKHAAMYDAARDEQHWPGTIGRLLQCETAEQWAEVSKRPWARSEAQ